MSMISAYEKIGFARNGKVSLEPRQDGKPGFQQVRHGSPIWRKHIATTCKYAPESISQFRDTNRVLLRTLPNRVSKGMESRLLKARGGGDE